MAEYIDRLVANLDFWAAVGVLGQMVFASRMIVQWYVSEKRRRSTVPVSFWWISIFGSVLVLIYGVKHAQVPVILGQSFGFVVYIRNLMLIYGKSADARLEAAGAPGAALGGGTAPVPETGTGAAPAESAMAAPRGTGVAAPGSTASRPG